MANIISESSMDDKKRGKKNNEIFSFQVAMEHKHFQLSSTGGQDHFQARGIDK
jgi:hypothetical protein